MSAARPDTDAWLYDRIVRGRFLALFPQYAAVLAHVTAIDDPSIDVMAVSSCGGRFYLHVRREYFAHHPEWLAGVLLHEVHHVVLGHVTHPKFRGLAHPDLLELAMEMSANESVHVPLPPHVALDDYTHLGIAPRQSTLERYTLLVRAHERRARGRPLPGQALRLVDDHGPWMRAVEGGERDEAGSAGAARLARILADGTGANDGLLAGRPLAGRSPGDLLRELEHVPARPVDWRAALRAFFDRQRARTLDYCRPNRRFPHRIGQVPARVRRPTQDRPRVLVAIDTSASMTRAELDQIAAQLARLGELATIVVAECDSEIQRVYPFTGRLVAVRGGGGTDLGPVFHAGFLDEHRARGVVYFTDGEGPFPPEAPPVPTLWVLTKSGGFRCPWGEQVWLAGRTPMASGED